MTAWQTLFSLQSSHEFFHGDVCTALDFVPTPACDRLLLNSGVVLRQKSGSLAVHADSDRFFALPDVAYFDFHAYANDSCFLNYTDGISPSDDVAYYLCSALVDPAEKARLSKNTYVSIDDRHPTSQIPSELIRSKPPAPVFLIRIAVDTRAPKQRDYLIPLRARRTYWHYYIVGSKIAGTELYVADTQGVETFDYCGETKLPNGRLASHFRSKTLLALQHDQSPLYSLFERYSARSVVKWLPTPSPRLIGKESLNGEEELASQMFVNL